MSTRSRDVLARSDRWLPPAVAPRAMDPITPPVPPRSSAGVVLLREGPEGPGGGLATDLLDGHGRTASSPSGVVLSGGVQAGVAGAPA